MPLTIRPQASRFASRGAFDALATSDNEHDEQEDSVTEPSDDEPPQQPQEQPKLTRTQQKKLAKEARNANKAKTASHPSTPAVETPKDDQHPPSQAAVRNALLSEQQAPTPPANVLSTSNGKSAAATAQTSSPPPPPTPAAVPVKEPVKPVATPPATATAAAPPPPPPITIRAPEPTASSAPSASEKTAAERAAYWRKIRERTTFTFVMIFGFVGLLLLGHPYMIILVLVIQVLVYREVTALFDIPGRPSITGGAPRRSPLSRHNSSVKVPKGAADDGTDDDDDFRAEERKELIWSKTLSWYFFTVANFFLYGESLIYYFKHIVFVDSYFIPFARHHRFLSFLLYIIGFVGFVSGLRRENLKHQFGLFGWVHMSLLLIVFSSHFLVNNILEGLVWFFVPASLVICNDVFAYVCGMIWGKTPLISLSPKKTVEGFVGAFIITEVFAYGWATLFQRYQYMICPATSLGMNAFQDIACKPNTVFEWHSLPVPAAVSAPIAGLLNLKITAIPYTPFQLHTLVMAAFASLVAPFGGFFASGFKRAFNIKDFGDSIPGHGGLTDRFDCQFLMGLFSYVYYSSLIREHHVTVGSVLQTVVTHLSAEEQLETYRELGRFLVSRGQKV